MKLSNRSDELKREIERVCLEYMEEVGAEQMDPGLIFYYMAQKGYGFNELWEAVEEMKLIPENWRKEGVR